MSNCAHKIATTYAIVTIEKPNFCLASRHFPTNLFLSHQLISSSANGRGGAYRLKRGGSWSATQILSWIVDAYNLPASQLNIPLAKHGSARLSTIDRLGMPSKYSQYWPCTSLVMLDGMLAWSESMTWLCTTFFTSATSQISWLFYASIHKFMQIEDGCRLTTVDEIADAVNQLLGRVEEEAAFV